MDDNLESILNKGKSESAEEDLGPCVSRVSAKWLPGFHVKHAKLIPGNTLTTRSFDYSHMGYREFGESGDFFIVEVNEPEKWRIRVEGRALWKIYHAIHHHKLEWIEPAVGRSAKAIADGVPVIVRITVERIEDKRPDRSHDP